MLVSQFDKVINTIVDRHFGTKAADLIFEMNSIVNVNSSRSGKTLISTYIIYMAFFLINENSVNSIKLFYLCIF